ncbi:hypothetical protein E6W36_01315 [Hankyongella ginsenosidimutans]|uniref:Uncharacterized protein n=1 Tax=Hankyongella ginsenosidimutans TaxID=1763828 RepID=A0A4D7BZ42_9SPHN|nr:hypothetical protein [Hankyongella ginsenosidimutans]QCI78764.1 hypothetical protein E6W36_01315 [Hankyongella ginsenosidimutans]
MMQPVAGGWQVQLVRPQALEARDVVLEALDAAGDVVGENSEAFPAGESVLTMTIAVPPALAAKVSRLRVRGQAMAAGVSLIDAGSTRPASCWWARRRARAPCNPVFTICAARWSPTPIWWSAGWTACRRTTPVS